MQQRNDTLISYAHLSKLDLQPPRAIVDNFLYEGLTILAGMPKFGKSFMSLNMALSISSGASLFGSLRVNQCNVLYLALEDSANRVKERADVICRTLNVMPPDNLFIKNDGVLPMFSGGLDQLEFFIQSQLVSLVIIDTFAKFTMGRKRSSNIYDDDYIASQSLHDLAMKYHMSIIAVHHTNKRQDVNHFLDNVSGSNGVIAAADSVMVIKRNDVNLPILCVTGRDIVEGEYVSKFDKDTFLWSVGGEMQDIRINDDQKQIVDLLQKNSTGMTISAIKQFFPDKSYDSVKKMIYRLKDHNVVTIDTGHLIKLPYAII
jgi:hypothetical protein